MSTHEWIKTALSAVNTAVLLVGAWFAYHEFIDKTDTILTNKSEETLKRIEKLSYNNGFLMKYFFDEDPAPKGVLNVESRDFALQVDDALSFYYSLSLCVKINKCDSNIVTELACQFILSDAAVINRSWGRDIAKGGIFIDRNRLWNFYEQTEVCINNLENTQSIPINNDSFLRRFYKDMSFLKTFDDDLFDRLKKNKPVWEGLSKDNQN